MKYVTISAAKCMGHTKASRISSCLNQNVFQVKFCCEVTFDAKFTKSFLVQSWESA